MLSPDDPSVRAFVRGSMIAQVATLSAKRRSFVTPLWFVVDGGALYITTGPESWAGKNVAQHPEVALLFTGESTRQPDRVLRLRGTATCHRGLPSWRVLLRIAVKYYVSPGALRVELPNASKWRLRKLYYGQLKGGFGFIRVVPAAAEFLARP
jgi:hypothetical protein